MQALDFTLLVSWLAPKIFTLRAVPLPPLKHLPGLFGTAGHTLAPISCLSFFTRCFLRGVHPAGRKIWCGDIPGCRQGFGIREWFGWEGPSIPSSAIPLLNFSLQSWAEQPIWKLFLHGQEFFWAFAVLFQSCFFPLPSTWKGIDRGLCVTAVIEKLDLWSCSGEGTPESPVGLSDSTDRGMWGWFGAVLTSWGSPCPESCGWGISKPLCLA